MSKNPFMKGKSRKRRKKTKTPITKPKVKPYCPRTMVRYDGSPNEYATKWVCKMCLRCMLSEIAVSNHLISCSQQFNNRPPPPPQTPKIYEDTRYICEFCNKVFSRRVTLKKHKEVHEKSSNSQDSELSDNDVY